jgi:ubiquinone/menaquinone biosynthesis C-methylase UbiE
LGTRPKSLPLLDPRHPDQAIRESATSEQYFAEPGTVVSWWDPLGADDESFKRYSISQQDDLLARCPVVGKKVLDCCTGRGRMAIAAAENGAASVLGLDVAEDMLDIARVNAVHAKVAADFRAGNITQLDMPDQSVDVVFCLEALLHLDDPWRAVKEFHRVLTRGGDAVITTNGANPLARLAQPPRAGARPAGRLILAAVTALNEVMTPSFGFMWRSTRPTGWLYSRIFRVPVRPLYRDQVDRMLKAAGFSVKRWEVKAGPFVREHRWIAHKL